MIRLYSYPALCGAADNDGYELKVFAFMGLAGLLFMHEHIFDARICGFLANIYFMTSTHRASNSCARGKTS